MKDSVYRSCKDCKERSVGCHATCKKYLEEKELAGKQKEELKKIKRAESDYYVFYRESFGNRKK